MNAEIEHLIVNEKRPQVEPPTRPEPPPKPPPISDDGESVTFRKDRLPPQPAPPPPKHDRD